MPEVWGWPIISKISKRVRNWVACFIESWGTGRHLAFRSGCQNFFWGTCIVLILQRVLSKKGDYTNWGIMRNPPQMWRDRSWRDWHWSQPRNEGDPDTFDKHWEAWIWVLGVKHQSLSMCICGTQIIIVTNRSGSEPVWGQRKALLCALPRNVCFPRSSRAVVFFLLKRVETREGERFRHGVQNNSVTSKPKWSMHMIDIFCVHICLCVCVRVWICLKFDLIECRYIQYVNLIMPSLLTMS